MTIIFSKCIFCRILSDLEQFKAFKDIEVFLEGFGLLDPLLFFCISNINFIKCTVTFLKKSICPPSPGGILGSGRLLMV